MKAFQILSVVCVMGFITPATAQDLPETLVTALDAQGFVVTSKRFTWLGRIFVEATDGDIVRAILISRGSGQILQDNWIAQITDAEPVSSDDDTTSGVDSSGDDSSNDRPPARPARQPGKNLPDKKPEQGERP